jgi:hypothetical protein
MFRETMGFVPKRATDNGPRPRQFPIRQARLHRVRDRWLDRQGDEARVPSTCQ